VVPLTRNVPSGVVLLLIRSLASTLYRVGAVPLDGASQLALSVRPLVDSDSDDGVPGGEQPASGKVSVTLFDDPLVPEALVALTVKPNVPAGTVS
jgi:hypothetical protein